jgi:hypothetical protein
MYRDDYTVQYSKGVVLVIGSLEVARGFSGNGGPSAL